MFNNVGPSIEPCGTPDKSFKKVAAYVVNLNTLFAVS